MPPGWEWARIGNVCNVVNGSGFPTKYQGRTSLPFPFVKVSDMNSDENSSIIKGAANTVDEEILALTRARTCPSGTVIFPKVGGAVYTNKKRILGIRSAFDNNIMGIVPIGVSPLWLFYCLQGIDLASLANVQALPSIKSSVVRGLAIPLPPLAEQKRIVAILNEQMAGVERAKKAAEERLDTAQALRGALLEHALNVAGFEDWPELPLGKLGSVASGITLGRKVRPDIPTHPRHYLRVANVKDGFLDLDEVKQLSASDGESRKYRLEAGDLLLTEGGDPDKLGRGCVWNAEIPNCLHQNHIFRVRFDQTSINPKFVSFVAGSSYGKSYFLANARRTTGIATINRRILEAFPVRLPPIEQQHTIVANLDNVINSNSHLTDTILSSDKTIEAVSHALLRRAFSGGT